VLSFYGIVDLLAVLPTYLVLLFPNLHVLIDVRIIRLLRIFRIFKLAAYVREFQTLSGALVASARKIAVFLCVVIMVVVVMGSIMYVVEGGQNGFTSIPTSIYWAITTMTTVGFGDITPKMDLGRLISSTMMLVGWGTLAVPTGIVTSELAFRRRYGVCKGCRAEVHDPEGCFCSRCGSQL
jgi:voltage-gated potassium channel